MKKHHRVGMTDKCLLMTAEDVSASFVNKLIILLVRILIIELILIRRTIIIVRRITIRRIIRIIKRRTIKKKEEQNN